MQPIERYGVIALLFLVITVVAVVLWDKEEVGPDRTAATKPDYAKIAERLSGAKDLQPARPVQRPAGARRQGGGAPPLANPGPVDAPAAGTRAAAPGPRSGARKQARPSDLRERSGQLADRFAPVSAAELDAEKRAALGAQRQARAARLKQGSPPKTTALSTPTAAAKAAPVKSAPAGRTYEVQPGDTLSEIAQAQLGSARLWKRIEELNPDIDAMRLRAGHLLLLPERGSAAPAKTTRETAPASAERVGPRPTADSTRIYVVRPGDNLSRIAKNLMGNGNRWNEIAKLNPKLNPDKLEVGQKLILPEGVRNVPLVAADSSRTVNGRSSGARRSTLNGGRVR